MGVPITASQPGGENPVWWALCSHSLIELLHGAPGSEHPTGVFFLSETLREVLLMLRVGIKCIFNEALTEALPGLRGHALKEGCLGYNEGTCIIFLIHSFNKH